MSIAVLSAHLYAITFDIGDIWADRWIASNDVKVFNSTHRRWLRFRLPSSRLK